jgi:alpha-beta hydrolase superfamily lysophospholipase
MAEHAKRYAWFMQVMKESGYAVYAHDIRGHGYTYAKNSSKGHFADKNGFDQLLHDLDFVIDLMKQDHPNIPIFCFGHSLGSILLLRYVTHAYHRINGIACWNSGIETNLLAMIGRIILSTERKFLHPKKRSNFAWILTFQSWANKIKNKRTNFDWLSHDKAQVDKYIDDKLCGFDVSLQSWLDVAEAVFYSNQNLSNIPANFPIHLLGGGEDPCTNYGKDMEKLAVRLKRNGHSNHILNTIAESRHETLNELKREDYARIFLEWLDSQLNQM